MALNAAQQTLVDRVLNNLDALDSPGANISASNQRVYEHIQEASRQLILEPTLSRRVLYPLGTSYRAEVNSQAVYDAGSVLIPLPDDYLRLLSVDVQTWAEPVHEVDVAEESEHYKQWLKSIKIPSTSDPYAFQVYYDSGVSWAGKMGLRLAPGDTTLTEVTATANVTNGTGVAVPVEALTSPIASGVVLTFMSGQVIVGQLTLTQAAAAGDTQVVGDLGTSISSGNVATHVDVVSNFVYVPETAPEDMPTLLEEPMLWLAAELTIAGIDAFAAGRARSIYEQALRTRRTHRHTSGRRTYRGL